LELLYVIVLTDRSNGGLMYSSAMRYVYWNKETLWLIDFSSFISGKIVQIHCQ